jgi:hypothetical protein
MDTQKCEIHIGFKAQFVLLVLKKCGCGCALSEILDDIMGYRPRTIARPLKRNEAVLLLGSSPRSGPHSCQLVT